MGPESLGNHFNAQPIGGEDWLNMQPPHLPKDLCMPSEKGWRTFACLLRKAGVDVLTIKDLGRWESLEMVQRYTRSVTFHDSLKHYKAPLS